MANPSDNLLQKILDKFSNSRDFTISFFLHVILVVVLGTTVLFQVASEPPDFEGESGGFVASEEQQTPTEPVQQPQETTFNVSAVTPPQTSSPLTAITTSAANPLNFAMNSTVVPTPTTTAPTEAPANVVAKAPSVSGDKMSMAAASQIKAFTGGWGKGKGVGTGIRQREFEFTAFIGQYQGGNWNSTVQVNQNKIVGGSLPNLLYIINIWSKDKIKTNEKNVVALRLDDWGAIAAKKPPFIFMTGTRDFKLSDKEVETLQKYLLSGGCIWGDSSLPGLRSRFDIAFRREMRRVIPDVDKNFEPLPKDHPIYTNNYYPEIKETPPGLNYYREPIFALKVYGEIAVIYTANDYGDMWQVGLDDKGFIDFSTNEGGQYAVINRGIWDYRNTYLGNLNPPAPKKPNEPAVATNLVDTYKFGTNIILHLLTRWESKTARATGPL